jgi:nucleoside-diphosphate-sugar epimerase
MKVVIAGGTGSLGRRVADDFAQGGYEIVILTAQLGPTSLIAKSSGTDERSMPGRPSSKGRC